MHRTPLLIALPTLLLGGCLSTRSGESPSPDMAASATLDTPLPHGGMGWGRETVHGQGLCHS